MAATGTAPLSISLDIDSLRAGDTQTLLTAILRAHDQVSDLIFSPGRLPQVTINGQLITIEGRGVRQMTPDDTRRIAADLIGENKQALALLREQGFCDVSYSVPGSARFRVNTFIQRGSCAVVMRVIPTAIPEFESLGLPSHIANLAELQDGLVLVTGPRGAGKSSTLAALLNRINETRTCHIITIEDPIEFLHNHKRATVHQRELHSDTPSLALGLRAAVRQSPDVILVGELPDRETIEMALEAAETGHLVLSSLNTMDAVQTLERLAIAFSAAEQSSVRNRLLKTVRVVISQRLLPRKGNNTRIPIFEILRVQPRIVPHLQSTASHQELISALKKVNPGGMQDFDGELEKLVRAGAVEFDMALTHATDPDELRKALQND